MEQMTMTEREMMEDSLCSQKHIAAGYNICAGECCSAQLRTAFLNILADEQELGSQVFEAMQARGWYQVEEAGQSEVSKAKQKFIDSAGSPA